MQILGYSEYNRYHIISGVIVKVKSMKDEISSEVCDNIYTSKQQITGAKLRRKIGPTHGFSREKQKEPCPVQLPLEPASRNHSIGK